MAGSPLVSVVIAAYNSRPRLMCAVETALRQTCGDDLEVVVVGDGLTDDSGEALLERNDPRIVWENLDRNWGEQSVPSNRGVELARGEYIFFLNQDDLWLPDHVETCLQLMRDDGCDAAFSPYLVVAEGSVPGDADQGNRLDGLPRRPPDYDPMTFTPASATGWRAESLRRLGGWRRAGEVTVSPSQDLLYRAKRAGMRLRMSPAVTVLVLWSGQRRGCFEPGYAGRDNVAWLSALVQHPELVQADIDRASAAATLPSRGRLRGLSGWMIQRSQELVGIHPATFGVARRHWRSGGFVNAARTEAALGRRDFRSQARETTR